MRYSQPLSLLHLVNRLLIANTPNTLAHLVSVLAAMRLVWNAVFFLYLRPFRCNVPGPLPLPLIGNWLNVISPRRTTLEPTGLRPIECYWLGVFGMKPYVFVRDPEIAKEIAIDRRDDIHDCGARELIKYMAGASDQSIPTTRGERWRRQRDALISHLNQASFAEDFLAETVQHAPKLLNDLQEPSAGRCPFHASMRKAGDAKATIVNVSEVICEYLSIVGSKAICGFSGQSYNSKHFHQGTECERKNRAWILWTLLATLPTIPMSCWCWIAALPMLSRWTGHDDATAMAQDHRQLIQEQLNEVSDRGKMPTVLAAFHDLYEEDIESGTSQRVAKDRLISSLVAMSNGTAKNEAAIAAYGLQELATNPRVQEKPYAEISQHLGDDPPKSRQDLLELTYLQAATAELLRLQPGFPVLAKLVERNTSLAGYRLARGCEVAVRILSLHTHPKYWDCPCEFRPERHLDPNVNSRHPFVYIPFGLGRRQCPARKVARIGIAATLCEIVRHFRIEPASDVPQPRQMLSLAIGFDGPLQLRLLPRGRRSTLDNEANQSVNC